MSSSPSRLPRRRPPLPLLVLVLAAALPTIIQGFLLPVRSPSSLAVGSSRTGLKQRASSALYAKKKKVKAPSEASSSEMLNSMISPPAASSGGAPIPTQQQQQQPADASMQPAEAGAEEDDRDEQGLSPLMYDKLRAEATTPFRSLRMFVYAGFGVGAGVGGYTAVTQLIQSVRGMPNAIPLGQAGVNVAVDVGVLAACIYAWVFENNLKKQTDMEMMELRAKEPFRLTFDMKQDRERSLSALPVTFQTGENATMTTSVKQLREKGSQHLIVLAAPKAELADALLGARIAKQLFAKNDVMIAPFVIPKEAGGQVEADAGGAPAVKGFGKQAVSEALLDAGEYVAKPADQAAWSAYVEQEIADAVKQGNEDARKKGIGVVMRKDGSIIRRGLGQPDWREVVSELTGDKKPGEYDDAYIPPIAMKNKRK